MARRKNSAEMLDILRRISRIEKGKGPHPGGKVKSTLFPPDARDKPSPLPVSRASHRGLDEPERRESPSFAEPSRRKENDLAPGRFRRVFLSVLSGGRGVLPAPRQEDADALAPLGIETPQPGATGAGEETETAEQVPPILEVAGLKEHLAVSSSPRAMAQAGEAFLAAPVEPLSLEGGKALFARGKPASPRAEYSPLGSRAPLDLPEADSRVRPALALPSPPRGVFSPRETPPPVPSQAVPSIGKGGDASPVSISSAPPPPDPLPLEIPKELPPLVVEVKKKADPRPLRPLFGPEAVSEGPLARIARRLWGEEISGGLKKRVEVRVVTIGLYVAVALGAMLLMAFILNPRDGKDMDRLLPQESQEPASGEPSPLLKLETTGAGSGASAAVRNETATPEGKGAAARGGSEDSLQVISGEKGKKGWYVQIRAFLTAEECTLIIDHLKELGYRSVWQRPDRRQANIYYLLLGPYPTKEQADSEIPRYKDLMSKNPLRKPRLKFTEPFVPREIR